MQVRPQVKPLTSALGAEITGIDLAGAVSDEAYGAVKRAFLDHGVVVLKHQQPTPDQFVAFGERFGRIIPHRLAARQHPDCPKIALLARGSTEEKSQTDEAGHRRDEDWGIELNGWHTDLSYQSVPLMATAMLTLDAPRAGGDLSFLNTYAAYDALPSALQKRIEGRVGTFCFAGRSAWKVREAWKLHDPSNPQRDIPVVQHPAVLVHPETGRKALYVHPLHSLGFVDMPEEEADELLDEIFHYSIKPEWEYRHKWESGDLVLWDNRSTFHSAILGSAPRQRRPVWRLSIMPK